jgi:hypothetical protein
MGEPIALDGDLRPGLSSARAVQISGLVELKALSLVDKPIP